MGQRPLAVPDPTDPTGGAARVVPVAGPGLTRPRSVAPGIRWSATCRLGVGDQRRALAPHCAARACSAVAVIDRGPMLTM
jgi:hypothetical protein